MAESKSRRALLLGGLGAAVGLIARPLAALADTNDGAEMHVGGTYTTAQTTKLDGTGNPTNTFWALSSGGYASRGTSTNGVGVLGEGGNGTGVQGGGQTGISGVTGSADGIGVAARNGLDGLGLMAVSGNTDPPGDAVHKVAMRAYAPQDSSSVGVLAESAGVGVKATGTTIGVDATGNAKGVHGKANIGIDGEGNNTGVQGTGLNVGSVGVLGSTPYGEGVRGVTQEGYGVRATATTGTALRGEANHLGVALSTSGRLQLQKAAGRATIKAGKRTVRVSPGVDILPTSTVIATLNGSPPEHPVLERVEVDQQSQSFVVRLSLAPSVAVSVAWIVLG